MCGDLALAAGVMRAAKSARVRPVSVWAIIGLLGRGAALDADEISVLTGLKAETVERLIAAMQRFALLGDEGDAGDAGDVTPSRVTLTDAAISPRGQAKTGAERQAAYRARQRAAVAHDGDAGDVTPSPLLEEEDQELIFSSDAHTREPVDNPNPWGGSGQQAEASRRAKRERWLANTMQEAANILPPDKLARLYEGALQDPIPIWAQRELDRIDAVVRQRKGQSPPPSLGQGWLKMPIPGGRRLPEQTGEVMQQRATG